MADVLLFGGPLHGEHRDIDPTRDLKTFEWEEETVEQDWDGTVVYVTRIGMASYRRTGPNTFIHCRTPTAIGDHDHLEFPETQLLLEELPRVRHDH